MTNETVQQLLDALSPEQRDIQAIVVAAAVNGVELSDDAIKEYMKLPPLVKGITEFIVGYSTANLTEAQHADILDGELAHFGVKGMRWGVRKDRPSAAAKGAQKDAQWLASQKVKAGKGTLGDAHDAALKSTGHRITNGVLGDKTFWKKTGIAVAGAYAFMFAGSEFALNMPSEWAQGLGASQQGGGGALGKARVPEGGQFGGQTVDEIFGRLSVFKASAGVATIGAGSAIGVNYSKNFMRAAKGNARIRESKKQFDRYMKDTQTSGGKVIQKTLRQEGSLRKKYVAPVKHVEGELSLENTLAHYGVKGQKWGVIRRTLRGGGPSSGEIKRARKVIVDPAAQKGYSRRELKGLNKTARRRTLKERVDRRTKQGVVLAIGAAVVKEYLQINGSDPMPSASPADTGDQSWRDDYPKTRNGPMFNPDATLDPSQVEIRK